MLLIRQSDTEPLIPLMMDARLKKRDQFRLLRRTGVELPDGRIIVVRGGFVTDIHSVARLMQSFLSAYDNRTGLAAILHDWLYIHWEKVLLAHPDLTSQSRPYADWAYLTLMRRYSPETPLLNRIYYTGVVIGGWYNWRKYRTHNTKHHPSK